MDITKQQASRHLGQVVEYKVDYDSTLLVAVERVHNRTQYGIDEKKLPFVGYDTWNAYEVSFLMDNGMPVSAVAKIVYDCESHSIVESKSLKLYLNSFNMSKFGSNKDLAIEKVEKTIEMDLSQLLGVWVSVSLHFKTVNLPLFENFNFIDLESLVDIRTIQFTEYNESPEIIKLTENAGVLQIKTNLLRSNCRITSQPDWGDAYIYIKSESLPTPESLMQYIVSFRKEDHFHEECVEMLYKRLYDACQPVELMVTGIYTRRGGIDINPCRATSHALLSSNLRDSTKHVEKELRQ